MEDFKCLWVLTIFNHTTCFLDLLLDFMWLVYDCNFHHIVLELLGSFIGCFEVDDDWLAIEVVLLRHNWVSLSWHLLTHVECLWECTSVVEELLVWFLWLLGHVKSGNLAHHLILNHTVSILSEHAIHVWLHHHHWVDVHVVHVKTGAWHWRYFLMIWCRLAPLILHSIVIVLSSEFVISMGISTLILVFAWAVYIWINYLLKFLIIFWNLNFYLRCSKCLHFTVLKFWPEPPEFW